MEAPLDLGQDFFLLQALPGAGEELSPPASQKAATVLLFCASASEQRFSQEVTHDHLSSGGNTTTKK